MWSMYSTTLITDQCCRGQHCHCSRTKWVLYNLKALQKIRRKFITVRGICCGYKTKWKKSKIWTNSSLFPLELLNLYFHKPLFSKSGDYYFVFVCSLWACIKTLGILLAGYFLLAKANIETIPVTSILH